MEDHDLLLARQLQSEFDRESALSEVSKNGPSNNKQTSSTENDCSAYQGGLSVIDPSWETTDPNPDVRALFLQYNNQYFWGKLAGVEVRWSPRMTLCAGVCHYEGRGGLCSIRLSVPLLKLRPRKDLVETLLHEMIHAYLFVTNNDRDRDEHGPNFQKHMHRINKASGAKITIYHSFHDEVDNYRQHWWRCNGPCKSRRPYYGWVKRAMNRAPSAQDFWWDDHVRSCGGTYIKVKEPEGYREKKKKGGKESKKEEATKSESQGPSMDIRGFLGKGNIVVSVKQPGGSKPSGSKKNVPSTVTNSQDKPFTAATPTVDFSPGVSDWQGGIWTPDKPSKQSSETQSSNKQTNATQNKPTKQSSDSQSSAKQTDHDGNSRTSNTQSKGRNTASNGQKNWTVVENEKDKANKLKSDISAGATSQSGKSGQVLGQSNGDGLSWLARMRKQWTKECTESGSSSPKTNHVTPCSQKNELKSVIQENSLQRSGCSTSSENKKTPQNNETQCIKARNHISESSSEGSHHSSFHVSSCEEDNWPSPDKYNVKDQNVQLSPVKKLSRKRVVLDLTSSDEEEFDFQAAAKRAKSVEKLKSREQNGVTNGDSDDFGRFKPNSFSKDNRNNVKNSNKTKVSQSNVVKGASKISVTSEGRGSENGSASRMETSASESNTSSLETSSASVSQNTISSSLVPCPVCQTKVPADDINRHLDACLS